MERAMTDAASPPTELYRPVDLDEVRRGDMTIDLQASPEEGEAIAAFLGLSDLTSLCGKLTLRARPGRRFTLEGSVSAGYEQTCVVTLEPLKRSLTLEIDRLFEVDGSDLDVDVAPDEAEIPDPIPDAPLDIGAVVLEELALNIDPYPRTDGLEPKVFGDQETTGEAANTDHPFAALAQLRKDDE